VVAAAAARPVSRTGEAPGAPDEVRLGDIVVTGRRHRDWSPAQWASYEAAQQMRWGREEGRSRPGGQSGYYIGTNGGRLAYGPGNRVTWHGLIGSLIEQRQLGAFMGDFVQSHGGVDGFARQVWNDIHAGTEDPYRIARNLDAQGGLSSQVATALANLQSAYDGEHRAEAFLWGTMRAGWGAGEFVWDTAKSLYNLSPSAILGSIADFGQRASEYQLRVLMGQANPFADATSLGVRGWNATGSFLGDVRRTYDIGGSAAVFNRYAMGAGYHGAEIASMFIGVGEVRGATLISGTEAQLLRQTGSGSILGSADEVYDLIRGSSSDVLAIAGNTGYKASNIQKVKDHLFFTEHLLDRYESLGIPGTMARFDSDLGIAAAWQRLEAGNHGLLDLQLLRHETAEAWYMKRWGPSYDAAHKAAQRRYPAPGF
jgi:hypothetical protein